MGENPCVKWISRPITDAMKQQLLWCKNTKTNLKLFVRTIFIYSVLHFLLKANRLSTLSLQYDKRMDDELRGGKRKIKLVQEQVHFTLRNSARLC